MSVFRYLLALFAWGTVSMASAGVLTLTIDKNTRDAWIENRSDSPVIFDGYGIHSKSNQLDLFGWRSFQDFIMATPLEAIQVLGTAGWGKLNSSSLSLFEGNLTGETTAQPGFKVHLGKPFKQVVAGDIRFEYSDFSLPLSERVVDGLVLFLGEVLFPWQNPNNRFDVNASNSLSPIDALTLINYINQHGPGQLPAPTTGNSPPPYLDVDGNGAISSQDVLAVVNELNRIAAGGTSTVPEPSTGAGMLLLLACTFAVARRVRGR